MNENLVLKDDMVQELRELGLSDGDSVIVHTSFRTMGAVNGGPDTVINALLQVLGNNGNLMLPTFNYTKPAPEPYFDSENTPARTGIISELGRRRPDAVRSFHPAHSVSVIGPEAGYLTENHQTSFGIGSPIDRLAQTGGKILLIGVGHVSNSTIHVAESHAGIPKVAAYEEMPFFKVKQSDGKIIEHQLDVSASCSSAFGAAEFALRERGLISDGKIGSCKFQLMKGQETISAIVELLEKYPDILLCRWPKCACCTRTRDNMIKQVVPHGNS